MVASASQWDDRYRAAAADDPLAEPADFVRELLPLLPVGLALDVACGTGRHTLVLAGRQQDVTAVDSSEVALETLERRARAAQHATTRIIGAAQIGGRRQGIQLWRANLEEVGLPAEAFAVVLCVNYLQRSLFRQMERALMPGGVLLFETFTVAQLAYAGGPRNPEYLLESGELRSAFPELRTLFYRELRAGKGIASLIARKPAG